MVCSDVPTDTGFCLCNFAEQAYFFGVGPAAEVATMVLSFARRIFYFALFYHEGNSKLLCIPNLMNILFST